MIDSGRESENPYEVRFEPRAEKKKKNRPSKRPWVLVVISGLFGVILGGYAISGMVGLAFSDLTFGQTLGGTIAYLFGMLVPALGFGFAANLFATGEQKRGDRYLCGSLFLACAGVVLVTLQG
jgi:hypothetical protein